MKSKPPIKQKYIESPEKLWDLFQAYIEQLEVIEMEIMHPKLGTVTISVREPMTMEGFKCYGHDQEVTIQHYIENSEKAYESYRGIVTRIKDKIYQYNFSRAAVGMYKEALISKQLGLKEKVEQTTITEQPLFPDKK